MFLPVFSSIAKAWVILDTHQEMNEERLAYIHNGVLFICERTKSLVAFAAERIKLYDSILRKIR